MLATHSHPSPYVSRPASPGGAGNVVVYAAGKGIYAEGDAASSLYQVEFGCIRVYRILSDGRRQICAFHYAGETFGFEPGGRHRFDAEVVVASGIRRLPFRKGTDTAPELLDLAMRSLSFAHEHLMILTRQGACERVAAFLLDTADRQGGLEAFELPMSRADIGDYLGMTIETVSRAFSKLKQRGHVKFPSLRTVEILKRRALEAMAE